MPKLFADLHAHPTLYGFNRMRNVPALEHDPTKFHPWTVHRSNLKSMELGKRAGDYSQCSMPKMTQGKMRLVHTSITPIEKAFFEAAAHKRERKTFTLELVRLVTGITILQAGYNWIRYTRLEGVQQFMRIVRNRGPLRMALQMLVTKYPLRRVRHVLSDRYDYWEEFQREYDMLRSQDGKAHNVTIQRRWKGKVLDVNVDGRYHIIRSTAQLRQVIEGTQREIACILNIEGGHVFSIGPDQKRVAENVLFERIQTLKSLDHPVFLLTPAHHFDNGFCGHARSMKALAAMLMDQRPRLGLGLEPENDLGYRVFCELLDLEPTTLRDKGGRRILLDTKHMSPRTRREYYDRIVIPYNQAHAQLSPEAQARFPKLPVIMSHGAYSGIHTLQELINNLDYEHDYWHSGPFYAWGINLSDDDIRMVHESEGMIGLIFDQRVLGVQPGQRFDPSHWPMVFFQHVLAIVDVIWQDESRSLEDKIGIWDRICIGTDYDGFIDPIKCYPTALSMEQFGDDMLRLFKRYAHTRGISRIGAEALCEKLAWQNLYAFTLKHFPSTAGCAPDDPRMTLETPTSEPRLAISPTVHTHGNGHSTPHQPHTQPMPAPVA